MSLISKFLSATGFSRILINTLNKKVQQEKQPDSLSKESAGI